MKHNSHKLDLFINKPEEFNKYSDKEFLKYCLGATLYMPSHKDIAYKIISQAYSGLTTMAMCFEDAIREEDLTLAENNVMEVLDIFHREVTNGNISINDLPLYFLRVRNVNQFKDYTSRLKPYHFKYLTGFIFPKFDSSNGNEYLSILKDLNDKTGEILYGMPILESKNIIYIETRREELIKTSKIISKYKEYILNVRVGATDFSSIFGVRRGIDYTVYDIKPVADCLSDILNVFNRSDEDYVLSAPVWEYFSNENINRLLKPQLREKPFNINNVMSKRADIINKATDGLIREVILDKANGFVGKTIIHPSHIKLVNGLQSVTEEEYLDAKMIIDNQGGGVIKGASGNKMNETNPHLYWAKTMLYKARAYGVLPNDSYVKLFID